MMIKETDWTRFEIMSRYNWNAEDYERDSQGQQKRARELIGKLSLKGTEKILDMGCGDGKVRADSSEASCDLYKHGDHR